MSVAKTNLELSNLNDFLFGKTFNLLLLFEMVNDDGDDDDLGRSRNVPRRNLLSRHVRSEQSISNHPTALVSTNYQCIEYAAFYSEPVENGVCVRRREKNLFF